MKITHILNLIKKFLSIILFLVFVSLKSQNNKDLMLIKNFYKNNQNLFFQMHADSILKIIIDKFDSVFNKKLNNEQLDFVLHITYYQNDNELRYYLQISNEIQITVDEKKNHMEIYYNNYCPKYENLEYGAIINYSAIYNLAPEDTINEHIITTKPINKKYKVWVSMCPRSTDKKKSIQFFKEKIYSQYQLLIFKNKIRGFEFYFILPPDKKYPIKYKIKKTKF